MDFKTHLLNLYNEHFVEKLLNEFDQTCTHACLLNTDKISDQRFLELFPGVIPHALVKHAYLYDKNKYDLGKSWLHEAGAFYLQDPSAMAVAALLNCNENDIVLDLCAAPGGKTIQSSLLMNNKGLIIANDISHSRALVLSQNVERMGRENIVVTCNDFSLLKSQYQGKFTKIILDAPCSGSGMFRKNAEMLKDWSYKKVLACQAIQKDLIMLAYRLLAKGGILCYSTCSYSKEENEDIIKFLGDNSDCELLTIPSSSIYLHSHENHKSILFPYSSTGEGQFVTLIKKPGNLNHKFTENKNMDEQVINKVNEIEYILPLKFDYKNLSIIRGGLEKGTNTTHGYVFSHHYSHSSQFKDKIPLNTEQMKAYYRGEDIAIEFAKGYYVVTYDDIGLGIVKSVNGSLKNHLPKGLRKNFK